MAVYLKSMPPTTLMFAEMELHERQVALSGYRNHLLISVVMRPFTPTRLCVEMSALRLLFLHGPANITAAPLLHYRLQMRAFWCN